MDNRFHQKNEQSDRLIHLLADISPPFKPDLSFLSVFIGVYPWLKGLILRQGIARCLAREDRF